jgi:hypothetical protein
MIKEEYIRDIERKLCNNERLDGQEIRTIVAALRESKSCYQEPYYEVIYHDQYGKTESRIMNPDYRSCKKEPFENGIYLLNDKFSVDFRRLVREEDL